MVDAVHALGLVQFDVDGCQYGRTKGSKNEAVRLPWRFAFKGVAISNARRCQERHNHYREAGPGTEYMAGYPQKLISSIVCDISRVTKRDPFNVIQLRPSRHVHNNHIAMASLLFAHSARPLDPASTMDRGGASDRAWRGWRGWWQEHGWRDQQPIEEGGESAQDSSWTAGAGALVCTSRCIAAASPAADRRRW